MSYTLSRKIGIVGVTYYSAESARPSEVDIDQQNKADALKVTPALVAIADKISPKELYARARIISKLGEMSNNREKTFGTIKSKTLSGGVDGAIKNLNEVIAKLTSETDITKLGDNSSINAWFLGWDGHGDTNLAVLSPTKMTYREFLSNVVNDSQLVASLFVVPDKAPEGKETEEIRQRTRLGTFLVALENKHPDAEYKMMFRQAHQKLNQGELDKAKDILRKTVNDEWKININFVSDKNGHVDALRAIGATYEAGQAVVSEAKKTLYTPPVESTKKPGSMSTESTAQKIAKDRTAQEEALISDLGTNFPREKERSMPLAIAKYDEMMKAIPDSDPYKAQVVRGKDTIIEELANEKAYMTILDAYVKKNRPDGLGDLYKVYNDMKGLNGFWNFSDENAKMTKEMAIMVASMALTAGIGPILGGIGIGARALAGASVVRTTTLVDGASKFKTGINAVSNASKAVVRGTLVGTARIAEAGIAMNDAAQASKLARIPGEALKFTTADALIRSATREAGEQSGFHGFAEKIALNVVMFGAFGGMEKFISGPTLAKITEKFGIKNAAATFALNGVVLTAGDIGVMQALHAAETGKFEWDWMSAYQALAFRIGMKGAEKILPKLTAKFNDSKIGNNLVQRAEMQKNGITIVDGKRVSLGVADKSTLSTHSKLEPQARISKAQELLGRKLNEVEQGALMKAHKAPSGNNIEKGKILMGSNKNPIFSREDAQILMDKKLAGVDDFGRTNRLPATESSSSPRASAENAVPQLVLRDNLATAIKENRFENGIKGEKGIPNGKIELTTGESITITPEIIKPLEKDYTEAMKIEPESARSAKLAELDTQFAERLILDNGRKIEVGSQENAQKIVDGLGKDPQYNNLQIIHEPNRNFSVSRTPKERINNLEQLLKNPSEKNMWFLDQLGIKGGTVKGLSKGNTPENNVYELSIPGKDPIRIEGSENLKNSIQRETRMLAETTPVKESAIGAKSQANEKILTPEIKSEFDTMTAMKNRIESIPKGTGEIAVRLGDKEYTINRHLDEKKLDVVIDEKVITYNSTEEFVTAITKGSKKPLLESKGSNLIEINNKTHGEMLPGANKPLEKGNNKGITDMEPRMHGETVGSSEKGINNLKKELATLEAEQNDLWSKSAHGEDPAAADLYNKNADRIKEIQTQLQKHDNQIADHTPSQSATTDKSARTPIEREQGLDGSRERLTQDDLLGGSFRKEVESLMSLDDATFELRYRELQSHGNIPNHREEIIKSVKKVRDMSDQKIIDSIIIPTQSRSRLVENNRQILRESNQARTEAKEEIRKIEDSLAADRRELHDMKESIGKYDKVAPHDPTIKAMKSRIADGERLLANRKAQPTEGGLSQSEKALIIAENAALRYRLKNMLTQEGVPDGVTRAPINSQEFMDGFKMRWLAIPAILAALIALHQCQGDKAPISLPPDPSPNDVLAVCKSCYNNDAIPVRQNRKINGREANDAYRISVSEGYAKTTDWKNLVDQYNKNQTAIKAMNPTIANNMDELINGRITVAGVQEIQHCIAMLDSNTYKSVDSKFSQDGMLGPITTQALRDYFTKCK